MMTQFTALAQEYFKYLETDYGFSLTYILKDPESDYNGLIQYQSSSSGIRAVLDRGQVQVTMGPSSWQSDSWIDLSTIIEFLHPTFDGHVYMLPNKSDKSYALDYQLGRLSSLVKNYTQNILDGTFSEWDSMAKFGFEKAARLYKQLTGEDLPDWA